MYNDLLRPILATLMTMLFVVVVITGATASEPNCIAIIPDSDPKLEGSNESDADDKVKSRSRDTIIRTPIYSKKDAYQRNPLKALEWFSNAKNNRYHRKMLFR